MGGDDFEDPMNRSQLVYHDNAPLTKRKVEAGNLNKSAIIPSVGFTLNKHRSSCGDAKSTKSYIKPKNDRSEMKSFLQILLLPQC